MTAYARSAVRYTEKELLPRVEARSDALHEFWHATGREVRALRLNDIDWAHDQIVIFAPKTSRRRVLPLTRPAGEAVLDHLLAERPPLRHREVFLSSRPPHGPLRSKINPWLVVGRLTGAQQDQPAEHPDIALARCPLGQGLGSFSNSHCPSSEGTFRVDTPKCSPIHAVDRDSCGGSRLRVLDGRHTSSAQSVVTVKRLRAATAASTCCPTKLMMFRQGGW